MTAPCPVGLCKPSSDQDVSRAVVALSRDEASRVLGRVYIGALPYARPAPAYVVTSLKVPGRILEVPRGATVAQPIFAELRVSALSEGTLVQAGLA
jgi:hypothetical protein